MAPHQVASSMDIEKLIEGWTVEWRARDESLSLSLCVGDSRNHDNYSHTYKS